LEILTPRQVDRGDRVDGIGRLIEFVLLYPTSFVTMNEPFFRGTIEPGLRIDDLSVFSLTEGEPGRGVRFGLDSLSDRIAHFPNQIECCRGLGLDADVIEFLAIDHLRSRRDFCGGHGNSVPARLVNGSLPAIEGVMLRLIDGYFLRGRRGDYGFTGRDVKRHKKNDTHPRN